MRSDCPPRPASPWRSCCRAESAGTGLTPLARSAPAPAPRFGQFYFSRKTATAYELYIFGGATAEFAPVLLNDMEIDDPPRRRHLIASDPGGLKARRHQLGRDTTNSRRHAANSQRDAVD